MKSLVVAPHPDDELIGCGGTLLKRKSVGDTVGLVFMTAISTQKGWSMDQVKKRDLEVLRVSHGLGISTNNLFNLSFPPAELDQIPASTLINLLSDIFKQFEPEEVFLPHPGDIHTDHRITFEAASACTKCFRYPSVKRILTYETLSETNFGFEQVAPTFRPNYFVDISNYIEQKMNLLSVYESEFADHPFPRSHLAIRSQAILRGSQRGSYASEAFQIMKQLD